MNREYIAKTFIHNGYTVKIIQDQDAESPRDWDNAGKMVCWHGRYTLGDERRRDDPSNWMDELAEAVEPGIIDRLDDGLYSRMVVACSHRSEEAKYRAQVATYQRARATRIHAILDRHYIMLPLRLVDHSGISMSIGRGAHPQDPGGWDSGQVGWIYMTKKKAVEEWGKKRCTKQVVELAEKCLSQEVETYNQYLTGDVYGFVIEDSDGDEVDSCWGHFGLDYAIQAAKEAVPATPSPVGGTAVDDAMEATLA